MFHCAEQIFLSGKAAGWSCCRSAGEGVRRPPRHTGPREASLVRKKGTSSSSQKVTPTPKTMFYPVANTSSNAGLSLAAQPAEIHRYGSALASHPASCRLHCSAPVPCPARFYGACVRATFQGSSVRTTYQENVREFARSQQPVTGFPSRRRAVRCDRTV